MKKKEIKIGDKMGYFLILDLKENGKRRKSWLCECVCGKRKVIGQRELIGTPNRNATKSCGCKAHAQNGLVMKSKRLYSTRAQMIRRCHNPKADNYARYGGKGITVCDEWRDDYKAFYDWAMANGYRDDLTIDRIDSTKPYQPDNCRWVDYYVQAQNKDISKRNSSGRIGVNPTKDGRFTAGIKRNGIFRYLGTYKTMAEAAVKREEVEAYFEKHGTIETYPEVERKRRPNKKKVVS